jgi:hypothetical protein
MTEPLPYFSPQGANRTHRRLRNTILLILWGLLDLFGGTAIAAFCTGILGENVDTYATVTAILFLIAAIPLFFWGAHTLRLAHSLYTDRPAAAENAHAACRAAQAVTLAFLSLLVVPAFWWSISIRALLPLLALALLFLIFAPALSLTRSLLSPPRQ